MVYWQHWQQGKKLKKGQYVVEKYLGGGGFGVTYQVKEQRSGKFFALKTLNSKQQDKSNFDEQQEKFINEAVALASCHHPHIVRVYPQMFKEDNLWCMVMEHIEGEDLAAYITKKGILSESEAIPIISKVGDALTYIHQRGLLHRDIKPQNILLRQTDLSPVVIDFGLAREFTEEDKLHSMTNAITESFAPIEQYGRKGNFGAWTDVYALAATLYVLLTGELPIPSRFRQHAPLVAPQQLNPKISDKVNQTIVRGMEFEPENRPQSVKEWLDLLSTNAPTVKLVANSVKKQVSYYHQAQNHQVQNYQVQNHQVQNYQPNGIDEKHSATVRRMGATHPETNRLDSQSASVYYERGNNSYSLKNYREAVQYYTLAIQQDPQHDKAYYRRGNAHCKLNNYQKAIKDYNQAIYYNPENASAYREKGNACYELKNYTEAIENYNQTIRLNPQYNTAYHSRGNALYSLKNYAEAIEDYDRAIQLNPQNAHAYYNRGNAKYGLKNYAEAIEDLNRAIQLDPENVKTYKKKIIKIHESRGDDNYKSANYVEAIKYYKQAVKLDPHHADKYNRKIVHIYNSRGDRLCQSKHYNQAIEDYTQAIKLDAKNAHTYRKKIIHIYDELIRLNPQDINAHYERGNIFYSLQDYQAAFQDYSQVIQLNPQHSDAYLKRGETRYRLGNIHEAIQDYNQAIKLAPQNLNIYYRRSNAYKKLGNHKKAEADFRRATKIPNTSPRKSILSKIWSLDL